MEKAPNIIHLCRRKAQLELQIQNWTREQENLNARTEKSTCYEMDSLLDTVRHTHNQNQHSPEFHPLCTK
jgi:hypothetical protein